MTKESLTWLLQAINAGGIQSTQDSRFKAFWLIDVSEKLDEASKPKDAKDSG